ncbi:MAG: two component, sigma54 specific, transcriptional regulator, Fis family [Deltaproteobacteria bacterium]|nr:two component, sigma54 specific, transcriptional regulator, Fis family [Deltaproteobacteria bacterium]
MATKLVLLVDDDPEFSQFVKALLTEKGMQVVTAAGKAEGQAAYETYSPACVILDIFLPDGSGVDLIRPMRAANSSLPIIIVSGQGSVDEVVRAMKEGASDYIRKPFHGEELFLKVQMVLENTQAKWELEELRTKVRPDEEYHLLFGMSDRMNKVQAILDQVAGTDITVLISGESGTGKELVAKAIHKSAQNGTIFLDEISEMHMDLQSKLLHVLQEKQFFRIGGEREVKAGCRILCATNKNLERMVEEGKFRRDLYYRINVVNILVPPLRDRKDDIPVLVDYFIGRYSQMYNRDAVKTSPKLMEMFLNYSWPGNVRELENNVKRYIILGNESQLISEFQRRRETGQYSAVPDDGPVDTMGQFAASRKAEAGAPSPQTNAPGNGGSFDLNLSINRSTLKEVAKIAQRNAERELIQRVLQQTRWNRRKAAQILDISYKALLYKIKECGLNME